MAAMKPIERLNLTLRALMELGVVFGFGYWGVHAVTGTAGRLALGIGAPLLGFGFWGLVDFHQAGAAAEPLRLAQELLVSGLAALALYSAGQHAAGWGLAGLSVAYHALVYASGGRLLARHDDVGRPRRRRT